MTDSDLFDPSLAPKLLPQIRELLALVSQASQAPNSLFVAANSETTTATGQDGGIGTQTNVENKDEDDGGANIALGSMAVDEGDDDATLAFLAAGRGGASSRSSALDNAKPTALSQEIVRRASELKSAFDRLNTAAVQLPGGQDMSVSEQQALIDLLEKYLEKSEREWFDRFRKAPV
ncbi:hypothetical protein BCV70DRAFT_101126 [Testicularia cyperi]|uniref:Uncharacterized protein n=1 Tax=Testicularia cyperi TaxID=1882483 RepID=A0A317XSE0_9BASI|nr:hypothetical protein BCV70DRAFT_101126 [Testicularia cyperi]